MYALAPIINNHACVLSITRGLHFGLNLNIYSYFVHASSEGSGESEHTHLRLRCSPNR